MNSFDQSKTKENLARSFAGESQEGARYQLLSKQCKQEGYFYIESLLKTIAKHEMSHAKVFFNHIIKNSENLVKNIDITAGFPFKAGTVQEGLLYAVNNETSESQNIYPSFAKVANDEGFKDIANSFTLIASVENCHKMLLEQLWNKLKSNKLYKNSTPIKWKCSECGHEATLKQPWEKCPLCSVEQGYTEIPLDMGT